MAAQLNAQQVQTDLLQQLYDLRNEFYSQLQNVKAGAEDGETQKLQDQNRRFAYRVGHLTNAVDELIKSEVLIYPIENRLKKENEELKAKIEYLEKK